MAFKCFNIKKKSLKKTFLYSINPTARTGSKVQIKMQTSK